MILLCHHILWERKDIEQDQIGPGRSAERVWETWETMFTNHHVHVLKKEFFGADKTGNGNPEVLLAELKNNERII